MVDLQKEFEDLKVFSEYAYSTACTARARMSTLAVEGVDEIFEDFDVAIDEIHRISQYDPEAGAEMAFRVKKLARRISTKLGYLHADESERILGESKEAFDLLRWKSDRLIKLINNNTDRMRFLWACPFGVSLLCIAAWFIGFCMGSSFFGGVK